MDVHPKHERFLQLFLPIQPALNGYLRTLIPSRTDAEDVLQAAAAVMWEKFDEFQQGTRFDRWAYHIAHLQALRYLTDLKRSKLVFGEAVLSLLADQAAALAEKTDEVVEYLDSCLEMLPPQDRELLRLRFEENGTNRIVARALGRSEGAISRTLSRLYGKLLDCIEQRAVAAVRERTP